MKNSIFIRTSGVKAHLLFWAMSLVLSCSNNNGNTSAAETTQTAPAEPITITGTVKAINFGKDGYTADVETGTEGIYVALVSIVNVGGRENYKPCAVGENVSFKGIPSELGGVKQLKVTEITSISPAQTSDAKYREIQPGDYCWQVNKVLELRTQPNAGSKVEGRHFEGELLSVLGTKIVDKQLWVNVTYKLQVKAGYEDQFADGQVMSSGSPTGWIGGAETPEINCK